MWFLPLPRWLRVVAFFVGLLVLAAYGGLRGKVCARAFAHTLFSPKGRLTKLASIATSIDHVICATDLHAGEHVYFSGRFVCAYRFGWGTPGDLPLHAAVQASAALPGAFPPAWLRTSRHRFADPVDPRAARARLMALSDGGVYDNMADQWPQEVGERNKRWERHGPGLREPDQLVVVNSSAPLDWRPMGRLRLPVLGEFLALKRDQSILYDNGTAIRRQAVIARFNLADREGRGLRGTIVQIDRSPYVVPDAFANSRRWPERAARARAALLALGETREEWESEVEASTRVPTRLSKLGRDTTVRLLRHAYVLAMVNLHVILGEDFPLLPLDEERFTELVSGEA